MISIPIYSALNVPTVTAYPSTRTLQWSADGQLFFSSKNGIYIMTPDHGINFDVSSALKSLPPNQELDERHALSWFRTVVQLDKLVAYNWPEFSQAWGAASLGSIDVDLLATVLSPSDVSLDGSCVLATLSTNMDVTLWAPSKNGFQGEWIKVVDVIPFLLEHYGREKELSKTALTIKSQVTSMTWSLKPDFGIAAASNINGSLFLTGTRAGSIVFMRYNSRSSPILEHVATVPVIDTWVTHVEISPWTVTAAGTHEACVAFGSSSGHVGLVKVIQTLGPEAAASTFGIGKTIEVSFQLGATHLYEADNRGIIALRWIDIPRTKQQILVHCKAGFLYLWSDVSTSSNWSGHLTFALSIRQLSVGSSYLHPVSGIQYLPHQDVLLITLFDGSFYVIKNLSSGPSWFNEAEEDLSGSHYSHTVRDVFCQIESGKMQYSDMNRISGVTAYDDSSTLVWSHETTRPADFSYKHDAKIHTMLVIAQLSPKLEDDAMLGELSAILLQSKAAFGCSPLHLLRPCYFNLRRSAKIQELLPRILDILRTQLDDHSLLINISPWSGNLTPELRSDFRDSLKSHLFGWDALLSLRMRLSMVDFVWKLCSDDAGRQACSEVASLLLHQILHRVLRTLIRHIVAASNALTVHDVPFVLRLIVQSVLPGTPEDITAEGKVLSDLAQKLSGTEMQAFVTGEAFNESCPACDAPVALQDITTAKCPNGHSWARCSITTFILSTPLVRTCVGCARKAFLPPGDEVTVSDAAGTARSWIVDELLDGVRRCLFCGNSFVKVV